VAVEAGEGGGSGVGGGSSGSGVSARAGVVAARLCAAAGVVTMPPPQLSTARRCALGTRGWPGSAGRRGAPAPLAPGGGPRRVNAAACRPRRRARARGGAVYRGAGLSRAEAYGPPSRSVAPSPPLPSARRPARSDRPRVRCDGVPGRGRRAGRVRRPGGPAPPVAGTATAYGWSVGACGLRASRSLRRARTGRRPAGPLRPLLAPLAAFVSHRPAREGRRRTP
jgi:hypothetical protein